MSIILSYMELLFGIPSAHAQIPASPTLGDIIKKLWNEAILPAIVFLFVLATVVFIIGLIRFIAGADSEEAQATGKRYIIWGIVGMFIMFGTGAIMLVISNFFSAL
ncbi:MAG: hypothetical protein COU90_01535 [Candidatus Ryanbacteria bacterium CG10_big_fil_rev_8_21_14_0_10_43_42]|uniref:Uncharacterized protein n=1 Tax=Candidatus Ryanbacteria bacterium CG10_big_fil_rev_8_21_14_0_10_43_42 TaxID=1974864 RepID=A0A2M8KX45_9BACT|nr:MAG: hypothetical protein COU90_01535 [Candidatus Ryanbacteria bacterium CG10_big_fil_rev_8_21_14_0_10_43_42]